MFLRFESSNPLIVVVGVLRRVEELLFLNAVDGTFPISFGYNYELIVVSISAYIGDARCIPLVDLQCAHLRWTMVLRQLLNEWPFHLKYGFDIL